MAPPRTTGLPRLTGPTSCCRSCWSGPNTSASGRGGKKEYPQSDGRLGPPRGAICSETEPYLRNFPELRIIDDELFAKAQARLKESRDAIALQMAAKGG